MSDDSTDAPGDATPPSAPDPAAQAPAPQPAPPPPAAGTTAGADGVLVTVGDIACTQTSLITPNGTFPLAGTNWIVTDNTRTTTKIPTHAIVLAIVFALLCLVGLLFLLMKEEVVEGSMQVTVQGDGVFYATSVPITDRAQVADVNNRVNYIRGLVRALAS